MILVDRRVGSIELLKPLQKLGAVCEEAELEFGDVAFFGHGPNHANVDIGVERKRISDLLSSIETGRLAGHQIPGLTQTYDEVYLLVEGLWRPGAHGLLEVWGRGGWGMPHGRPWMYGDVCKWLNSIAVQGDVRLLRTSSVLATCHTVHALAEWWDKPWAKHAGLKVLHGTRPAQAPLCKPSLVRMMAAQIPEIGWELSAVVDEAFASPAEMVTADLAVWEALRPDGTTASGRRRAKIGKARAERIVRALQEAR